MAPPRTAAQWLRGGLLALGTAAATYYVFEHYLSVLLPRASVKPAVTYVEV